MDDRQNATGQQQIDRFYTNQAAGFLQADAPKADSLTNRLLNVCEHLAAVQAHVDDISDRISGRRPKPENVAKGSESMPCVMDVLGRAEAMACNLRDQMQGLNKTIG